MKKVWKIVKNVALILGLLIIVGFFLFLVIVNFNKSKTILKLLLEKKKDLSNAIKNLAGKKKDLDDKSNKIDKKINSLKKKISEKESNMEDDTKVVEMTDDEILEEFEKKRKELFEEKDD